MKNSDERATKQGDKDKNHYWLVYQWRPGKDDDVSVSSVYFEHLS
jgi:hypothetical protein